MSKQVLLFHPAAGIVPLMDDAALNDLAASIREHGLKEPIVLHPDGSILDGRNRYLACQLADVTPRFETWDGSGSPVDYVIAINIKRRHLTDGQLAMAAIKAKPLFEAEARERQRNANPAGIQKKGVLCPMGHKGAVRDLVGAKFGVSGQSVNRAQAVVNHGVPALVRATETGIISVRAAADIATLPEDEQNKVVDGGKKAVRPALARVRRGEVREEPIEQKEKKEAPGGIRRLPKHHAAGDFRRSVQTLQGICLGLTKLNTAEILEASDATELRDALREAITTLRGVYRALGGNGEH